jgi:RNA polymerase sigma-70 factor (ECF subfamily)
MARSTDPEDGRTVVLLQRWHRGDRLALDEILTRDLPWIRERVRARLGGALRGRGDTVDFTQEALVELLQYGPRFEIANRQHFRSLLATIIENVLRGKHAWFHAQRRQMAREVPLASDTVIRLDPPANATSPSLAAARDEETALLRLAFELMSPEDREVLLLRQSEQLSFAEIGECLGVTEDAARMRFNRTLPVLAKKMRLLRSGDIEALLE